MIPDWLKDVEPERSEFRGSSGKARSNFIKKTIDGVLSFFQESMATEGYARRDGLLQSLDPRVKMISTITLVFAVSTVRDLRLLFVVYLLTLIFAGLSRIEILFFIKRVWLFIPIFSGVIAVPIMFNVFLPGDVLMPIVDLWPGAHLGPFGLPESIYITRQGALAATIFTLRVAVCVSAVVLMFLTTPQQLIFKSLRSLKVPKIYVLTLAMAYRYIFLFMDMIRDLHIAKKSRTIRSGGMFAEQKWVGGRIGYMLLKSLDMSERVHQAMISRGFNGDVKIIHDYSLRGRDYLAAATTISFSLILVLITMNVFQI